MLYQSTKLALLLAMASYLPHASARPLANEAGWQLTLNVNAGFIDSQSQMSTDSDNKITRDLNNPGQSVSSAIVFPLARLDYTFNDLKTQLFVGNSLENVSEGQFQLELGASHQLNSGSTVTLAWIPLLPGFKEAWQDPYLQNQARSKTDQDTQGLRFEWANIAGSLFSIKYGYAKNELDHELSGQSLALSEMEMGLLDRNSHYHKGSLDLSVPLGDGLFFEPAVIYTRGDAKGEAMSYDEYGTRLSLIKLHDRHRIAGNLFYSHADYDKANPIFNIKQKDDNWGLFAFYSYKAPFNWQNASFTLFGAWTDTHSNIRFYKSDMLSLAAGMAYTF